MNASAVTVHLAHEIAAYRLAAGANDVVAAWIALERSHILSQPSLGPHLHVHWLMLSYAWHTGDMTEVFGQLVRIALAPLGALTGRIPWGNTGRSNVSAFAEMEVPDDLRVLLPVSRRADQ